jgi:hypothetical protein
MRSFRSGPFHLSVEAENVARAPSSYLSVLPSQLGASSSCKRSAIAALLVDVDDTRLSQLLGQAFGDSSPHGSPWALEHGGPRRSWTRAAVIAACVAVSAAGIGLIVTHRTSSTQVAISSAAPRIGQRQTADGVTLSLYSDGTAIRVDASIKGLSGSITTVQSVGTSRLPLVVIGGGAIGNQAGPSISAVIVQSTRSSMIRADFQDGTSDVAQVVDGWAALAHKGDTLQATITGLDRSGAVRSTIHTPALTDQGAYFSGARTLFWQQTADGLAVSGYELEPKGSGINFFVPDVRDGFGVPVVPYRDFIGEGIPFCGPNPTGGLYAREGPSGSLDLASTVIVYVSRAAAQVQLVTGGQVLDSMVPVWGHAILASRFAIPPGAEVRSLAADGHILRRAHIAPPGETRCNAIG